MTPPTPWRRAVIAAVAGLGLMVGVALIAIRFVFGDTVTLLTGAVMAQNQDAHLQRPVGNARITVASDTAAGKAVSESSGLFRLQLNSGVDAGSMLKFRVEHPDFHPYNAELPAGQQIYIFRLTPNAAGAGAEPARPGIRITNVRVRYATRIPGTTTVGAAVRTFAIDNTGNVPCQGKQPCSPDGKWKANVRSFSLDTGDKAKQFRNVRLSCIAGPCPFSAIETDQFSRGGRTITASVRNWSDPVTYLLEAEVALTTETDLIRHTYPATFGRSMNFTLPAVASGPSIEAEVDGSEIVFPLGPELQLSWATCRAESGADGARQYRCELKQGFRFQ
jgi:hypothetical protein